MPYYLKISPRCAPGVVHAGHWQRPARAPACILLAERRVTLCLSRELVASRR